jgi:hypothetical protein
MGITRGAADLALELAVACRVHVREWRTCADQRLRVCDAARGAKNTQELVAFPPEAAKKAKLLENHGPGNDGKEKQKQKNTAGDQAGLGKDISDIGCEKSGKQKNDVPLSESR